MKKKKLWISPKLFPEVITKEILLRIKFFLKKHFLNRGLFIAKTLIFIKATKDYVPPPRKIEFLISRRYAVPIPEEQGDPIFVFEPYKLGISLHNFYVWFTQMLSIHEPSIHHLMSPFTTIYNPIKYSDIQIYPFKLKFDIWEIIWRFSWLLRNWSNQYFTTILYFLREKSNSFSFTIFNFLFEYYANPNKPLKRILGSWFLNKKIGLAQTFVKPILLKQLYFECKNIKYTFNETEKWLLEAAKINTADKKYFWPLKWLFTLDNSIDSGLLFSLPIFKTTTDKIKNFKNGFLQFGRQVDILRGMITHQFIIWWNMYVAIATAGLLTYISQNTESIFVSNLFWINSWELVYKKTNDSSPYSSSSFERWGTSLPKWYQLPYGYYGSRRYFLPINILELDKNNFGYAEIPWDHLLWKLQVYSEFKCTNEYYYIHNHWMVAFNQQIIPIYYKQNRRWSYFFKSFAKGLNEKYKITRDLFNFIDDQDIRLYSVKQPPSQYNYISPKFFFFPKFLLQFFDLINWIVFSRQEFTDICIDPFFWLILEQMEQSQYSHFFSVVYIKKWEELRDTHRSLEKIREIIKSTLLEFPHKDFLLYRGNNEMVEGLLETLRGSFYNPIDMELVQDIPDLSPVTVTTALKSDSIYQYKKKKKVFFLFNFSNFFAKLGEKKKIIKNSNILNIIIHKLFKIFIPTYKLFTLEYKNFFFYRTLKWFYFFTPFFLSKNLKKKNIEHYYPTNYTIAMELDSFLAWSDTKISARWKQHLLHQMQDRALKFKKKMFVVPPSFKQTINFFWLKLNLIEHYSYSFSIQCALTLLQNLLYYYFLTTKKKKQIFIHNITFPIPPQFFYSFYFLDTLKFLSSKKYKYSFVLKKKLFL